MTATVEQLFVNLGDDAKYLLGRKVEVGNWDCSDCSCPFFVFYLDRRRRHLRARCSSCGTKAGWIAVDDHEVVSRIAAEDRWDRAINRCEKELGRWWFDDWFGAYRTVLAGPRAAAIAGPGDRRPDRCQRPMICRRSLN